MFVDRIHISIASGTGGDGKVSFLRLPKNPKGGPDGGDGGYGGDLIVVAKHNTDTLSTYRFQKEYRAPDGGTGSKKNMHGNDGEDLILPMPVGTQIFEDGELIADLDVDGKEVILCKGGKGGYGNRHFMSSVNQAPDWATKGRANQEKTVELVLKSIADVGLVGLPNAGKSSLITTVTNSKAKIANYPFTTLTPNLGVVKFGDEEFTIADIPGLIEGASLGKGLGDDFLQHIERTRVIVHVIDSQDDVTNAYKVIRKELEDYKPELAQKFELVALNKIDLILEEEVELKKSELLKCKVDPDNLFAISTLTEQGIPDLIKRIAQALDRISAVEFKIKTQEITENLNDDGDLIISLED